MAGLDPATQPDARQSPWWGYFRGRRSKHFDRNWLPRLLAGEQARIGRAVAKLAGWPGQARPWRRMAWWIAV